MYLFIDESGDTGFKGSSTEYFVISIIIFDSVENLQATQIRIEEFKKFENLNKELHFCKTPNDIRDRFFEAIKNCNFVANAICVEKKKIYKDFLINNPDKFYNYVLKMLLNSLNICEEKLSIILDGKGNKTLERELRKYLQNNSIINIKKIKNKDSKADVLLQLADMVASCIGHSYNKQTKLNADKWKKVINNKIRIWDFR